MTVRVRDVTGLLDAMYDPSWAEDWDAVGLVCGDPEQPVSKILYAVDPTAGVVEEAKAWGADLVVVHHPLLLKGVHGVAATTPKGRIAHDLIRGGIALFTAHTNADAPEGGVNDSLARALGLLSPRIIAPDPAPALDLLVVHVPVDSAEAVRAALRDAGAGAVGDYDGCSSTSPGEGRFRPLPGATPAIGRVGAAEVVPEARIEVVLPRGRRDRVVAAMRAAHPYEEPAFSVLETADVAGDSRRGHGRIGDLERTMTLREYAELVGNALPATAHGVRVAGDPDREVTTVAVTSGSGDFLLDTVLRTEADVYVTSDLRHHRAGEFLDHDGPALIDVSHWAAEWTWLPQVEARLARALDTVETRVSKMCTDAWRFRA